MKRRQLLKQMGAAIPAVALSGVARAADAIAQAGPGPIAAGPFSPEWSSLEQYRTPDWFRDAKFGIWAHWGPQCEPESGDWYGRAMYEEGGDAYRNHLRKYGHPSRFGFKDVIHQWKAERWDPDALVAFYKKAGARYFVALANHHDNFDLYASRHQPEWNSTRVGPRKDLIAGWSRAARANGLRFGVSVHAAHAWTWYETAQGADKNGPLAGVPYDGNLTRADGKGLWWDGLDPQGLYAQRHPLSKADGDGGVNHEQWHWGGGAAIPDQAYCDKFYKRTRELIDTHDPDLVYYDDTVLPLWPFSDVGLRLAAHMYNRSIATKGKLGAVVNGKILNAQQRRALVLDVERGQLNQIEPLPWQTCTCIGSWHYDRRVYDNNAYKSARTVVHILIDVVSKNGNLLLSVPVRGDGTIDEKEHAIVEEVGHWMARNSEGIYDTRPWAVFGEGPAMREAPAMSGAGFNEGKTKPFTAADIRFTAKGKAVYAFLMGWPENGEVVIESMRSGGPHLAKRVARVELLGSGRKLAFRQTAQGLRVTLPADKPALAYANALKII
ncbi:alpha-L-fucosidase [Pseudoduganella namucuonensis]|uniref:alpha-L-fucosidase n=1 Tax=Pseudoduganella namucuonensis TaxID=1035707 RepID=A0A1I7LHL5_9BURK|nr:alpha-L-fucosidase [Pseudoduganella namucuonensis]SFV09114.1 alpha-L-fucosidase [Pseudoduganella namucuonensis]